MKAIDPWEVLCVIPDYVEHFIVFFAILAFFVLWFAVALYRLVSAKQCIKKGSHLYDEAEMRRRKRQLIISSVLLGIVVLPVLILIVILLLIELRIIPFN